MAVAPVNSYGGYLKRKVGSLVRTMSWFKQLP